MASDLQRKKIALVFDAMDVNGDGFLERKDFEALTDRWVALRGTGDAKELREVLTSWWYALQMVSDQDGDRRVTRDEAQSVPDRLGAKVGLVMATARSIFDAVDEDGDGQVTAAEYNRMIQAWTGRRAFTDDVFRLLDLDGNGTLSKAEFSRHWVEFWTGDNPDAPGTHVFGRI
ncbi:EF-hand domain-containing protein [Actinosynnema sp. NPDC020468]|uniref:EF-hand domain-containing protein n=1 Tax=Actinosynnema sp. NPDC020468 TaxID=3154488 RepID=UPI0033D35C98